MARAKPAKFTKFAKEGGRISKNEIKPHLSRYWKIHPEHCAAFVAAMEDILSVYERPCDPKRPVVCLDESLKQLVGEMRPPIPMSPGNSVRIDDEYIRLGMTEIFRAVEPLAGRRFVEIRETRKAVDWAHFVERLVDVEYPDADTIVLGEDNLDSHSLASLYEAFPREKAHRIASKLEMHFTPKHGSWLDIAEIELSACERQCISERIDDIEKLHRPTKAWCEDRNTRQSKVDWQFRAEDARIKLKRLYANIYEGLCTSAGPRPDRGCRGG